MELIAVPGNDIPEGLTAGSVKTRDGVNLRYALSIGSGSRGTVCIFPGRAEYIERYFETIRNLRARGFSVAILDWRGQGGSDRRYRNRMRGHVASFEKFDIDLETFMTGIVLPDCPPPYYALAHSTGANVVMRALRARTWFSRAVMSAPLLGLPAHWLPMPAIRFVVRLAVVLGLGWMFVPGQWRRAQVADDFPGNPFTSDVARFTRDTRILEAAPQLGIGGPTFGWLNAALKSIDELSQMPKSGSPRAPCLLIASSNDRVVSTEATRMIAHKVPGVVVVVIENARHELLNERNELREQFWAAFDSFVDERGGETHIPDKSAIASA